MKPLPIITASDGDTVDALIWRERGLGPSDLAAVFELNPGLAALGAILPAGHPVTVPAGSASPQTLEIVQLWD